MYNKMPIPCSPCFALLSITNIDDKIQLLRAVNKITENTEGFGFSVTKHSFLLQMSKMLESDSEDK